MPADLNKKIFTKKLQTTIFSLHGFLGTSHDMAYLHEIIANFGKIDAPDLFSPHLDEVVIGPMEATTRSIYKRICNKNCTIVGLGYSLGGRLILETEKQYPNTFNKIIIISSHPGLLDGYERKCRIESDIKTSQTLIKYGFHVFLKEWDSKEIFKTTTKIPRHEKDFSLSKLANALSELSLGHQHFDQDFLAKIAHKTLVIVGEEDKKYLDVWNDAKKTAPELTVNVVHGAGHRVFSDNPHAVAELLRTELMKL